VNNANKAQTDAIKSMDADSTRKLMQEALDRQTLDMWIVAACVARLDNLNEEINEISPSLLQLYRDIAAGRIAASVIARFGHSAPAVREIAKLNPSDQERLGSGEFLLKKVGPGSRDVQKINPAMMTVKALSTYISNGKLLTPEQQMRHVVPEPAARVKQPPQIRASKADQTVKINGKSVDAGLVRAALTELSPRNRVLLDPTDRTSIKLCRENVAAIDVLAAGAQCTRDEIIHRLILISGL